jgi:hypothetical protein
MSFSPSYLAILFLGLHVKFAQMTHVSPPTQVNLVASNETMKFLQVHPSTTQLWNKDVWFVGIFKYS